MQLNSSSNPHTALLDTQLTMLLKQMWLEPSQHFPNLLSTHGPQMRTPSTHTMLSRKLWPSTRPSAVRVPLQRATVTMRHARGRLQLFSHTCSFNLMVLTSSKTRLPQIRSAPEDQWVLWARLTTRLSLQHSMKDSTGQASLRTTLRELLTMLMLALHLLCGST